MRASQERSRERILTQADPARVRKSTDAVVLKEGSVFLVSTESGDIPFGLPHGFGLFFRDCRFLDGYELTLDDVVPTVLSGLAVRGFETHHHLTNPEMDGGEGRIAKNTIELRRQRVIRGGVVHETVSLRNYGRRPARSRLQLRFRSRFEDIFVVKGFVRRSRGTLRAPEVAGQDRVELCYQGADGDVRTTTVTFAPAPARLDGARAIFDVELPAGEQHEMKITITPTVGATATAVRTLIAEYAHWSGDLELVRALRPNIDAALGWIAHHADADGDGYLDYAGRYENGLVNQGWKDSGNAIVNADGSLAEPPIALCEVQAYAYRAWRQTAALLRRLDDPAAAEKLDDRADELRSRFDRDFWADDLGCYVLARQAGGRPAAVVSSNAGQVLWGGLATPERAARVAERLMAPDMFSGWGIRTLSEEAAAYNPMSYHLGSVWPHDNSLIVAGLRRYAHDAPALRVFDALFDAASNLRGYRLPELYCGYDRNESGHRPIPYPVACSPQAWAAGSLPYALWSLLGLCPDAAAGRLEVRRPRLPAWLDHLELHGIQVGSARVDLRFVRRGAEDLLEVEPSVTAGEVEVHHREDSAAAEP